LRKRDKVTILTSVEGLDQGVGELFAKLRGAQKKGGVSWNICLGGSAGHRFGKGREIVCLWGEDPFVAQQ